MRSSNHYVHGVVGVGELVGGELGKVEREEVLAVLAREMGLETTFRPALFQDLQRDLVKIDEVSTRSLPPLLSAASLCLSVCLYLCLSVCFPLSSSLSVSLCVCLSVSFCLYIHVHTCSLTNTLLSLFSSIPDLCQGTPQSRRPSHQERSEF